MRWMIVAVPALLVGCVVEPDHGGQSGSEVTSLQCREVDRTRHDDPGSTAQGMAFAPDDVVGPGVHVGDVEIDGVEAVLQLEVRFGRIWRVERELEGTPCDPAYAIEVELDADSAVLDGRFEGESTVEEPGTLRVWALDGDLAVGGAFDADGGTGWIEDVVDEDRIGTWSVDP